MTQIPIYVNLIDSDKTIARDIMKEIANKLHKILIRRIVNIDMLLRAATFKYLQGTETYVSLVGGELAGHFGIPSNNRQNNIDTIISAVSNRMSIEYKPIKYIGHKFTNGIKIRVLLKDLSEVLSLTQGVVGTEHGDVLEWLRWLLTKGDSVIIKEYDIKIAPGLGRSGMGIMISDSAESWRVPLEYAGTMRNNWLTRALNENSTVYLSIIEKIIKTELQRI